jgi:DNA-binding transcriptional ArsR family regulator
LVNIEVRETIPAEFSFSFLSPFQLSVRSRLLKENSSQNILGITLELTLLISSSCRQKILETLSKVKQTHIMDLVRKVNSTYCQVNRNLQILEQEGIVSSNYCGRMRIIKLNSNNPKTIKILKAIRILKTENL